MALGHLLLVSAQDQRDVTKLRYFPTQSTINGNLARRVRQVLFRPYNVGNAHGVVVDNYGIVVDRKPIRFDDNIVANASGIEGYMTSHHIVKGIGFIGRNAQTNGIRTAFCFILSLFFCGQMSTVAIVLRGFSLSQLVFPYRF